MITPPWTPLHIELMIHYHCSPAPLTNADAPAVIEYTNDLLEHGLIEPRSVVSGYRSTERGRAFITMLIMTPLPVSAWADASGNIIKF